MKLKKVKKPKNLSKISTSQKLQYQSGNTLNSYNLFKKADENLKIH